jgi:predicted dehydrogenase
MKRVRVGIIGTKRAANTDAGAIRKVYGVDVDIKAVASLDDDLHDFANRFGISVRTRDYHDILKDGDIDAVVICTPPQTHIQIILDCIQAGKHVITEKPLTGYFGVPGDVDPIGKTVPKIRMYENVCSTMHALGTRLEGSGALLMYAENFVYTPSILKAMEFITKAKSKVLHINGYGVQSGSPSVASAHWSMAGGGSLNRVGIHNVTSALHIKRLEGLARGETIKAEYVNCETAYLTGCLNSAESTYLDGRHFVDVEDWCNLVIGFTDGSKATITVSDARLGGTRNSMSIYTNESSFECNIVPNDQLQSYIVDPAKAAGLRVSEKIETVAGWQQVWVSDEVARGYLGEFQDFMECLAEGRKPASDFDLAVESLKVVYGAYVSAEEGRKFKLD